MRHAFGSFVLSALAALVGMSAAAWERQAVQRDQVIRSRVDLITSDLIVRDPTGTFVADLGKEDVEIYEDGVKQELVTLTVSRGGRIFNLAGPARPLVPEGLVFPSGRPPNDVGGRILLLFVDDLHLDPRNTPRIRDLFRRIGSGLIRDGDLFGVVSTGPSSIAIDLTYDRKRLEEAIGKITGTGMRPQELIDAPQSAQGSAELRHRAQVAFSTARDILRGLEDVRDRRKAFVYVSNGYDFDPFPDARARQEAARNPSPERADQANDPARRKSAPFAFADLAGELAELIRAANRANASLHTIDPRGLVAGPDIDEKVDMAEWNTHVRTTQETLRTLAEQTGGIALVNQNDFERGLKRIDDETSDYYVLGYYSTNADLSQRRRAIEVRVKRPGVDVKHRTEYYLREAKD